MTVLAGWIAVDQRSVASVYLASDSRFTWAKSVPYDYGRKVFAFKQSPDIVAYCGEVVFSSIALARAVAIADSNLLFQPKASSAQRSEALFEHLQKHFASYPKRVLGGSVCIYHVSRDNNHEFHFYKYHTDERQQWKSTEIFYSPSKSVKVFSDGAGATVFNDALSHYENKGISAGTSRNIFQCFCDCLLNHSPPLCGGAPQLVGLYRVADRAPDSIKNGMDFGIMTNGKRYYLGAELDNVLNYDKIRWYNDLFEICDGNTMKRKKTAMPQPNPLFNLATP